MFFTKIRDSETKAALAILRLKKYNDASTSKSVNLFWKENEEQWNSTGFALPFRDALAHYKPVGTIK